MESDSKRGQNAQEHARQPDKNSQQRRQSLMPGGKTERAGASQTAGQEQLADQHAADVKHDTAYLMLSEGHLTD